MQLPTRSNGSVNEPRGWKRGLLQFTPLWQFSVSCRIPTHWKLRCKGKRLSDKKKKSRHVAKIILRQELPNYVKDVASASHELATRVVKETKGWSFSSTVQRHLYTFFDDFSFVITTSIFPLLFSSSKRRWGKSSCSRNSLRDNPSSPE